MNLLHLILVLVVVGLLLYASNTWLPLDAKIKTILNVVVIIAVIVWLLAAFFPGFSSVRVG
jgi:hypothetical protein